MRYLELNERLFLFIERKFFERFDNGTQCDLSCHVRILMLRGVCPAAAYYVTLNRSPICKLSHNWSRSSDTGALRNASACSRRPYDLVGPKRTPDAGREGGIL